LTRIYGANRKLGTSRDVGGSRFTFYFSVDLYHLTMEPSCANNINDLVQAKFGWKQEKLVFCLPIDGDEQVDFDIVPYLGRGVGKGTNLTFPNSNLEQKDIIALFKQQALKQGVRLTTVASSANSHAHYGRFFRLACNRFRGHSSDNKNKSKVETSQQSTTPRPLQLYNPNVKIGTLRASRITRGLEGKRMPRKMETTKSKKSERCGFNFTFQLCPKTDSWVLSGGTGSCDHQFHPKSMMDASFPSLRETPDSVKKEALEFYKATNSPATAATIISFRTGLELTSSQLTYLKRKKDNSEGIQHKSSADDLLAYLRSRDDVSYMCLYDTVRTDLLATRTKGRPSKQQKIVEM
jgi:hypothetical protein